MKKKLLILGITALLTLPAPAKAIYCSNCSNVFVQALERVTNLKELETLTSQYAEALQQTAQQIEMVQNMIQNTASLPGNIKAQLAGQLRDLASLTGTLKTQRGEMTALAEVFNTLFPEQSEFADLAGASPAEIAAANQKYRNHYDTWSSSVDQASEATFQLSGHQLQELQDTGELENYINSLLQSPDGQMKAIQAGNQLATIQIQEARQLRELMATKTQSSLASQMKAEKISQMEMEQWKEATTTSDYDSSRYNEPLP
ncbi:P-type conjugative transfer protein TrbJ [Desulfocastanea catecholica]